MRTGALDQALPFFEQCLPVLQAFGDLKFVNMTFIAKAVIARSQGDMARAATFYAQGLVACDKAGDSEGFPTCVEGMAAMAASAGDAERAARLLGAAEKGHPMGLPPSAPFDATYEQFFMQTPRPSRTCSGRVQNCSWPKEKR